MNWRIHSCGIIFLFWPIIGYSQFSVGDFLRSAMDDPDVAVFKQQEAYLKQKPYQLSYLQKLELRSQNREFKSSQQEYALRFNPANPWEVRNSNQYFKAFHASLASENVLALKEALLQRYCLVISYLYHKELMEILKQVEKSVADQVTILEKQSGSGFFDADKYATLKIDQLDKSAALEEVDFEIAGHQHAIERLCHHAFTKDLSWDFKTIIPVTNIRAIIDSLDLTMDHPSTTITYQQRKIELARSAYKLEKANINPGFLQTEYDHRRVEQGRTPFNISIGIAIPLSNPNKGDMTKRHLDNIEAENDLKDAESEEVIDGIIAADNLQKLLLRYDNLQDKISQLEGGTWAQPFKC